MTKQEFLAAVLYHCLDYKCTRRFKIPAGVGAPALVDEVYEYILDYGVQA